MAVRTVAISAAANITKSPKSLLWSLMAIANAAAVSANEQRADHAAVRTELLAIGATVADYKALYDVHTHECQGSSAAAGRCSTPDTGAAENGLTASAASAFTDTTGGSVPPTLTAPEADTITTRELGAPT
jgi:hypothetical protein